ncbi:MAG: hypothetical protein BAJALOKI2v1_600013 [Promethearchaeota archaeon]|nr:MAG: hypothetical protein BAJALOKI2v1_600013 [Candidatus Lokiarchaeota archaeon]
MIFSVRSLIGKKPRGISIATILTLLLMFPIVISGFVLPARAQIVQYSPDGRGYLQDLGNGKYLLHVEGSPYEMGYQAGYLDPDSVSRLGSKDWFINVISGMLDAPDWVMDSVFRDVLDYNRLQDVVGSVLSDTKIAQYSAASGDTIDDMIDKLVGLCTELVYVQISLGYVPQEFLTEIQGVYDGCLDAGGSVLLEDLYLLNIGMDAMLALAYPVVCGWLFWMDLFNLHSCAGFVATDDATTNGQTIMGRHWQFTEYITHEEMLIMEFEPDNGYKILSTNCAGFVGLTSAMNDQGLGIGMDMSPAEDCDPAHYGMGTLLTARYAMQYCSQFMETLEFIAYGVHGCSWIYGVGDGRNGETGGCALEVSDTYVRARHMSYEHPWWAWFSRDQIEHKNDLVTYTNHYIHVRMNDLSDAHSTDESKLRYEWLTNDALYYYGSIDLETGATIIDYLHPPRFADEGYYSDPSGPVGASVTCWDLTNLQGKALFGFYDDSWVNFGF